ncbi:MAG: HU family DNA-binding protein [Planctomycetes bacterium]|nr:HU family DNA-binding protein [Planctomycetota bacterium]
MNKATLIDSVYGDKTLNIESKSAAERYVNAVFDHLRRGIKKDRSVQVIGFGTFTVKNRKARTGRNPQTGDKIKIKASKTVSFKPGKGLKAIL